MEAMRNGDPSGSVLRTTYIGKMRKLSDSGKLNYLQDAIKTPLTSKMVTSAPQNGDSFDSVYEALDDIYMYDQPRD